MHVIREDNILSYNNNTSFISLFIFISSVESQKGASIIQRCSTENQKGAIAIDFVQR